MAGEIRVSNNYKLSLEVEAVIIVIIVGLINVFVTRVIRSP